MASLMLLIAMLAFGPEFGAQMPACDVRDRQTTRLANFHEMQLGWRLLANGVLVELWGSEVGTWTLLETTPLGVSCILDVGAGEKLRQGAPL